MTAPLQIYWFRHDLRINDNLALFDATQRGQVLAVYILDDANAGRSKLGAASRWWLHHSLHLLNQDLNNTLNVFCGDAEEILLRLAAQHRVASVYWNRCYEPWRLKQDRRIEKKLRHQAIEVNTYNGSLQWEPWTIYKEDGTPYKVFTAFYRACMRSRTITRVASQACFYHGVQAAAIVFTHQRFKSFATSAMA